MDAIEALKGRRAINFFDPARALSRDAVREILSIAALAPSSFNLQPWRVVVVDDPERKKALRKCAFDQPKVEEAPVVLIVIADPAAVEVNMPAVIDARIAAGDMAEGARQMMTGRAAKMYGEPDSMTRAVFAAKNTALFAMSVMIAARGMGLESHPMDGISQKAVKEEFGIPQDKLVPMLIALGYLKEGVVLRPRSMRFTPEAFAHYNNWPDSSGKG